MEVKLDKIHSDARGDIYQVVLPKNRELMLFFCRAGHLRGGHSHDCTEAVFLLSGKLRYHKMVNGQEVISEMSPGDVSYNLPGVPHLGEFLEDSWVVDWKTDAGIGEFTTTDYEPFRARVRESMA